MGVHAAALPESFSVRVADAQVAFMLPGVAPTHKRVSIPLIVVVTFEGDKVRPRSRQP